MTISAPAPMLAAATDPARLPLPGVLAYGALGLPLAFAALPIYVHLPRLYGEFLAIPLALLGTVLLLTRLGDALIDPLLGQFSDRWQRGGRGQRRLILFVLPLFALGFWLLFNPPAGAGVAWLIGTLTLTYLGFSLLTITYQAWGARMSRSAAELGRLTASREGFGLVGVILAATLPGLLAADLPDGLALLAAIFLPLLAITALLAVKGAPRSEKAPGETRPPAALWHELAQTLEDGALRRLLTIFMVSGIAAALPATLVLFYIADVLGAAPLSGAFLATYFIAGLCALPFWVRRANRRGALGAWQEGMLLACLAFAAAPFLGPGDSAAFFVICALSGLALGADLVLPATFLATIIRQNAATCFGLWNLAAKLNLALAAGIALPLLAATGYVPGSVDPANNLAALALCYGGLPLVGKLIAAAMIERWRGDMQAAAPSPPQSLSEAR